MKTPKDPHTGKDMKGSRKRAKANKVPPTHEQPPNSRSWLEEPVPEWGPIPEWEPLPEWDPMEGSVWPDPLNG